ncbi:protein kinase C-binding protein NELL2-like isoform X2 [Euwallacea fornicatus]|uniref:protein kinase C-binding protein NELL2-like isoform X2 n=1 Tax=Euwallacea fornicatus TaxID=995702 RepID=UPI00338EF126
MALLTWTLIAVFLLCSSHRQLTQVNGLESISGFPGPPGSDMDLLASVGLTKNGSRPGISLVPGYLTGKPAFLLEGSKPGIRQDLMLPSDAFREAAALLQRGSEFTIGAWLRQEIGNVGTIFSVAKGPDRFLEVQSSGRRNEIRLHYTSLETKRQHMEPFSYRLADNTWHHLAVSVSGSQVEVLVDCRPVYKRVLRPGQPDRNVTDDHQIWVGQRLNHFFFRGILQDVRLIEGSHGVLAVCPQLDVTCPTCGQFLSFQTTVQDLQRKLLELSQRVAHAEMRLTRVEDCDCQKSCRSNDTIHADGSTWQTGCEECSCKGGSILCKPVPCKSTDCKHPVLQEGECCPKCLKQCYFNDVMYDHNDTVTVEKCKDCTCVDGSMDCKVDDPKDCPKLNCALDQQIQVSGHCCPVCTGVDYCAKGHFCHANATCRNLQTTFACQCDQGFRGDGRMCVDIDECQQEGGREGHHCHSNTRCVNSQGSYDCECLDGYVRIDRFNCAELDECSTGAHNCDLNADCVNTEGSYKCQCKVGYEGDGYDCTPICEPGCLNGGVCTKPGQCKCPGGYTGSSCERDLDECSTNAHRCTNSSICINMVGWYYCKCKPGYEGPQINTNLGTSCIDINECEKNNHTCHQTAKCRNVDGGFECTCPRESVNCKYSCIFENREIAHGMTVQSKEDPCKSCTCQKGVITCQEPVCDCRNSSSDPCCPQCNDLYSCTHQELASVRFMHGEIWSYQCQTCECLHGEVDCFDLKCPPLICSNPVHSPGDCCPHCVDGCSLIGNPSTAGHNCTFRNVLYPSGTEFVDPHDPCVTCGCKVPFCEELVSNTACCVHRTDVYAVMLITVATILPHGASMECLPQMGTFLNHSALRLYQLVVHSVTALVQIACAAQGTLVAISFLQHLKSYLRLEYPHVLFLDALSLIVPISIVIRASRADFLVRRIVPELRKQVTKGSVSSIKCLPQGAEVCPKVTKGKTLLGVL